jgi:hypothetical protein
MDLKLKNLKKENLFPKQHGATKKITKPVKIY